MSHGKYEHWKGWSEELFGQASKKEKAYFKAILRPLKLRDNAKILEMGFGNGAFLGFCKKAGFEVFGVEIIKDLVNRANEAGIQAFDSVNSVPVLKFDLIVMIDVLEHIRQEEIIELFNKLNNLLAIDGKIIIRTPNGSSPFGLSVQHGDITHCTVVTDAKMRYWCEFASLKVKNVRGDIYPYIYGHNFLKMPLKIFKRIIHIIIEKIVRITFYSQPKGVLSSNLYTVLEKV